MCAHTHPFCHLQLKAMDVFSPEFDESMIQALMVPVVASLQTDSLVQRIAFTEMEDLLRRSVLVGGGVK